MVEVTKIGAAGGESDFGQGTASEALTDVGITMVDPILLGMAYIL